MSKILTLIILKSVLMKIDKELLTEVLRECGLSMESKLYRYTSDKYIQTIGGEFFLTAKTNSSDIVEDHYEDKGHYFVSEEIGAGISFLKTPEKDYERPDRVLTSIIIKDAVDQGGLVYKVTSLPAYLTGFYVSIPEGKIKVQIEETF